MESKSKSEYPWVGILLSYFTKLKSIDEEIDKIRVSLCEIEDFSPNILFQYLDKDNKSFLTLKDFISFLNSENVPYDEYKLRKMIHNFDKDNDFSLNLNEFIGMIFPRKNEELKNKIQSMDSSNNKN